MPGPPDSTFADAATVSLPTMTNEWYSVTMGAHGEITSLIDETTGRELVASAIHDIGSGSGTPVVLNTGPVSTTLEVDAGGALAHRVQVTLYHEDINRLDIDSVIQANFGNRVVYDYDFDITNPTTFHEEVGMIATARRAAEGGDYADENARVDYLTFGHFLDIFGNEGGVLVSNWDSSWFRLGASTPTSLDADAASFEAVVGMQVDGSNLGIENQGGDSFFRNRFAIVSHGFYYAPAGMQVALAHQNPLVAIPVTGGPGSPLPAETFQYMAIGPSVDVAMWAVKPAEEGPDEGTIVRVWNLAPGARTATIEPVAFDLVSATRTTHIETDLESVPVSGGAISVQLQAQEMATFRLRADAPLQTPGDVGSAPPSTHQLQVRPTPVAGSRTSRIAFTLPQSGSVTVTVHDASGRELERVVDAQLDAGEHAVSWPGPGVTMPAPGVYFVRVASDAGVESTKLLRLP